MSTQESICNKLIQTFNLFDIFGNKVQLTVFNKLHYSTIVSKLFSILTFILSIFILSDDIRDLLNHSKPNVLNTIQQTQNIPMQILQTHNFTFALSLINNSLIKIEDYGTIYEYEFFRCNRTRYKNENGQIVSQNQCQNIPMEQCSMEKNFASPYAYEYFKEYTLKNMRCIDSEWLKVNSLNISGQKQSAEFTYFQVNIKPCQNTTSNNSCAPKDIINQKLNSGAVEVFLSSSSQDDEDSLNPYHLTIKEYTSTFQKDSYKTIWITYLKQDIFTDDGLFQQNIKKSSSIQIDSIHEIQSQYSPQNQIFCQIGIYLTDQIKITKRSYTKAQQILGNLGGFYSVIFQVLFLILRPLMNAMMKLDICNAIFKNERQNNNDDPVTSQNQILSQKQVILEVIKMNFGKSRMKKQIEYIDSCMDISYIIKQFFILEKLKLMLLNEQQLNFLDNITIEQHLTFNQNISKSSLCNRTQEMQEIKKIIKSREVLNSELQRKQREESFPFKPSESSHTVSQQQRDRNQTLDFNSPNINEEINDESSPQVSTQLPRKNHPRRSKFKNIIQNL